KGAPFAVADAKLYPEAGACKDCPKMTGNARELFPDGRADMCTDPACFNQKVKLNTERVASAAEKRGITVLKGKDAAGLFQYGWLSSGKGYINPNDVCYEDKSKR